MEARKSRNWMELYGMELDLGWMIWTLVDTVRKAVLVVR